MTVIALPAANEKEDEDMLVPRSDLVEGPQPMAVEAPEATENNAANQPTEVPRTKKITWKIENFSRITAKRIYSGIFDVGDYKWQILIFPKGNDIDALSMYLGVTDSASLPYGWTRYTHFKTQYQFSARKIDWGFASFMPLGELYDPSRGYLVNDTCLVEAEVGVDTAMDPWLYDSKKETGFVGLKNQGATCYMNSLLQTLYHIPYFRKVVYHMPTNVNGNAICKTLWL
ncbi:ubiquitin C-terminal hydrolase 12-like [Salvia splendens]|uniref:ubiquitin C-terminal hydrolase 12-like n=1 Tax=Salvia splendens TaxID=180675 RepID=UPI001C27A952|nr:ubiquitin C-terminal hydrolase 12-like [Salvia splendens]